VQNKHKITLQSPTGSNLSQALKQQIVYKTGTNKKIEKERVRIVHCKTFNSLAELAYSLVQSAAHNKHWWRYTRASQVK